MAFDAMGLIDRKNEAMDARPLDDRFFREMCIVGNGHLYAFDTKHGHSIVIDEKGKKHVRGRFTQTVTFKNPDWLSNYLRIPYALAYRLAKAFRSLEISSWETARRILNPVLGSGTINTPKAQFKTKFKGEILQKRGGLRRFAPKVGPVDMPKMENAINTLYAIGLAMDAETHIEPAMVNLDLNDDDREIDTYWAHADLGPDEKPFCDDEHDELSGDPNAFTAHKLIGDGSDGLSCEAIDWIKDANDVQLTKAAQKMRPYWQKLDGEWIAPNRGLTGPQVSQFWAYWKARRAEIKNELAEEPAILNLVKFISTNDKKGQSAALIYALKSGSEFKIHKTTYNHAGHVIGTVALQMLWAAFNEKWPKPEQAKA
jgi:hypothetical protein